MPKPQRIQPRRSSTSVDRVLSCLLKKFLYHSAAMDNLGKNMEVTQYTEKLVPSTRFVAVDGVAPKVSDECFVAPSASLVGDVTVGKNSR